MSALLSRCAISCAMVGADAFSTICKISWLSEWGLGVDAGGGDEAKGTGTPCRGDLGGWHCGSLGCTLGLSRTKCEG